VLEANPRAHVVRSSWLFGARGKNFVATMLMLGGDNDELTVVDDQTGCPTYTGHLAAALLEIAGSDAYGVWHAAGGGACTWHDLAAATFARAGREVLLHRGDTASLGRPAPRPAWSVLGSERPDAVTLPSWEEGLDAYLAEFGMIAP
jgi:dTDP-4-dehydrorhamnose reductase